jgi:hypothetical protein
MPKITRFFNDISITTSGIEILDILSGIKNIHNGIIEQIIIQRKSGSATLMNVEIRYEAGYSGREKLIYLFEDAELPTFVDSDIHAPFSLSSRKENDGDIHLYILPDANCTVSIRLDINLEDKLGI